MGRTIAGLLTVAALLAAGCGGQDPPSLDEGREAWMEAEGTQKQDLARMCRTRAAAEIGDLSDSMRARQRLEAVDLDALIGRIDEWYAQQRPNPGTIGDVCFSQTQDLAVTATQSEIDRLQDGMAP